MDVLPLGQQHCPLLSHDMHRSANLAARHAFRPDKFRRSDSPDQVDLRMAVAENMDAGWPVVVDEDDHAQSMGARHDNHVPK